jgi:signal transduction histidine kinase
VESDRAIDLLLALLNAFVAVVIVVRGRSHARRLAVALLALAGFFALRAISRLTSALGIDDSRLANIHVGQLLDVLLVAALVAILMTIERVLHGVAAIEDSARLREVEYERATRHYTQVVRHRMMNPLASIRGSAITLRDTPGIDETRRGQLLDAIVDATDELEEISLVPERRDELERDLDAIPHVAVERRRRGRADPPTGPS